MPDGERDAVDGIAPSRVDTWLENNVEAALPPFRYDLIAGGRSNLTFLVEDGTGTRFVLRRPPIGDLAASAHDVAREFRIISALAREGSTPVPQPIALCEDAAVNDAPFYVMEFVDGLVAADPEAARRLAPDARPHATANLVDVLSTLHQLDVDEAGLGELARRDEYIARQIRRWQGQYERAAELAGEREPALDELHSALTAQIPEQQRASIVHGDYRLENVVLGEDGTVRAVLDWELTTLGDPLADLGLLLVYWSNPGGDDGGAFPSANSIEGFPAADVLITRYAERSALDLAPLGFYVAFGFWKLACIAHGIATRARRGTVGGDRANIAEMDRQVASLARRADAALAAH